MHGWGNRSLWVGKTETKHAHLLEGDGERLSPDSPEFQGSLLFPSVTQGKPRITWMAKMLKGFQYCLGHACLLDSRLRTIASHKASSQLPWAAFFSLMFITLSVQMYSRPCPVYEFARVSLTNWVAYTTELVFSPSSGGWRSTIKVLAGLVSSEASLRLIDGYLVPVSSHALCVPLCPTSLCS